MVRIDVARLQRTAIVCQYGVEEFAILLPNTPLESAAELAERYREPTIFMP